MTPMIERFYELVGESQDERLRVRRLVATNRWTQAESDLDRLRNYLDAGQPASIAKGAESLIGETLDYQMPDFLERGAAIRRAVAYIEVNATVSAGVGSGFLISPDLFLTNQHVIPDVAAARGSQITFDREMRSAGGFQKNTVFALDPDRFALFSAEEELDFALIAVGSRLSGDGDLADYGHCVLSDRPDRHAIGMNVNIIQHPGGRPKMIAIRNNVLSYRTPRTLLYETDTETGSSGSPVFNDRWELVALHHYGRPFLERMDESGQEIPTAVNEGVRISAIHKELSARMAILDPEPATLLAVALSFDTEPGAVSNGPVLSPPRPNRNAGESLAVSSRGTAVTHSSNSGEIRVTLPLEITIRLGETGQAGTAAATLATSAASTKVLVRGGEKLTIDADYANRSGYVSTFLKGLDIPLPEPTASLAQQIAPLKEPSAGTAVGELRYEHFSLVMNKTRRLAMFTATNIDGERYLQIDRITGTPSDRTGAEGETWFRDPRISASYYVDQAFYSAWSTYFDRGHLTRRTDPTWGPEADAVRANADTYHFTNCSPQHFRFNQSARFWQGAERYVLERGVFKAATKPRLTVFQGPVFSDTIDRWADDLQIPSSFFKVIVWEGETGLKVVGLVVDQLELLDETRVNMARPKDVPVDIKQWRVSLKAIEQRTGLSFVPMLHDADTIAKTKQPNVGEAQRLVGSFEDLLC